YQKHDSTVISAVTLKLKGMGYVNRLNRNEPVVIDGTDYTIPPVENAAVFIMTSFIQTHQVRTRCEESRHIKQAFCTSDEQCANEYPYSNKSGRWTGNCLIKTNATIGLCELEGWCPVEDDKQGRDHINDALNFTIFLKNFVEFPEFDVVRKNFRSYMTSCIYNKTNKLCPIFRLRQIVEAVENDEDERASMLKHGAVIRLKIYWDCNFDLNVRKCVPEYSFRRIDTKHKNENFSKGFNFRFVNNWKADNRSYRILKKAFGLRIIISVSGEGRKFDLITLTLNIGSIMGIFGVASMICEIFMLHLSSHSEFYKNLVFENVGKIVTRLSINGKKNIEQPKTTNNATTTTTTAATATTLITTTTVTTNVHNGECFDSDDKKLLQSTIRPLIVSNSE
ncbi:unnamed protein product, partial [Didymodactylos carnosus]